MDDYGTRHNSTEKKGLGYFGALKGPDGSISTELSIGVNLGGKETEIPSLVPTLSKEEIEYLLNGGSPTPAIVDKAATYAIDRIKNGKSPFAAEGEQVQLPSTQPVRGLINQPQPNNGGDQ